MPLLSLLAVLGASMTPSSEPQPAPPGELPTVLLSELRAHPLRYLHRPVRLVFQYDGPAATCTPGPFSRFDPRRDAPFQAWSDDQFLWEPDAHADPAARLTVRAGSVDAAGLRRARRYDRYVARAEVREVYGGVPWIAVENVRRLPEFVGEGALIHAGRAHSLMTARRYVLAGEQYERATAGRLPAPALGELERLREECLRRDEAARIAGRLRRGELAIGKTPDVPH